MNSFPWSGLEIDVIGDVIVDEYYIGQSSRISPEAPVPILALDRIERRPGGAAAVAAMCAALGAKPTLWGVVGDQGWPRDICDDSIRYRLYSVPGRSTTTKRRVVVERPEGWQQIARIDSETTESVALPVAENIAKQFYTTPYWPVIAVDYGKGLFWADGCGGPVLNAAARRQPSFFGAKGIRDGAEQFSAVCMNRAEANGHMACEIWEKMHGEAIELQKSLIVTDGESGCEIANSASLWQMFSAKGPKRRAIDCTGAGDQFLTTLSLAMAAGVSVFDAAILANRAAGMQVERQMVCPVTAAELAAEMRRDQLSTVPPSTVEKIGVVSADHLVEYARDCRAAGLSVAYTNGCFDLLHGGHLKILREAARQADRLVVVVNGDESARQLKGLGRPVQSAKHRADLIASLDFVAGVAIAQTSDEPIDLIRLLDPDVVVKGNDSHGENHERAKMICLELGIRVHLVPVVDGIHTTAIVDGIRRNGCQAIAAAG